MLHRTKKQGDMNKGKWIGIGGHMEERESPEDCIRRETKEETGFLLENLAFRGIITFVYRDVTEYMYLFTASYKRADGKETASIEEKTAAGEEPLPDCNIGEKSTGGEELLPDCNEGDLQWVRKEDIPELNLWEGDRIFLKLLAADEPFFSLKLVYRDDDTLSCAELNGEPMYYCIQKY